jgi:DNA replication protein DnaC
MGMRRIGDVLSEMQLSVAIGTRGNGAAAAPAPAYACPVCKDAGFVRADVPPGHPLFGKPIECRCTEAKREARRELERRQISDLDSHAFARYTFDEFEHVPGTEAAFDAAYAFAREPDGWLFLHGGCGVGKTHLAVAVAHEQRAKGNVIFAVVPDLLDYLRSTFDPANGAAYDERFTTIKDTYLLVLDDLGTENTTPWAREKLFQIVNHRYNWRLPMIVTSNREHRELDERIVSRLLDRNLTRDVAIDAEDYRRRGRPDYVRGRGQPRRGR